MPWRESPPRDEQVGFARIVREARGHEQFRQSLVRLPRINSTPGLGGVRI
jgi:hypothetical protein